MGLDHVLDHVPDRERLAVVALAVLALKPVEAALRIVRGLLLWNEQGEAVAVRERRPACAIVVAGCSLEAAMENNNQGRRACRLIRHVGEHTQVARVGAKARHLTKASGLGLNGFLPRWEVRQQASPLLEEPEKGREKIG